MPLRIELHGEVVGERAQPSGSVGQVRVEAGVHHHQALRMLDEVAGHGEAIRAGGPCLHVAEVRGHPTEQEGVEADLVAHVPNVAAACGRVLTTPLPCVCTLPVMNATLPTDVDVEVVLLAGDRPALLDRFARGLHARLSVQHVRRWSLTIAVDGADPSVAAVAGVLGSDLDRVTVRTVVPGSDLKERRRAFAGSAAATVAFVRVGDEAQLDRLLAPLFRDPVVCMIAAGPVPNPADRGWVTRRQVLGLIGGVSITALLAACSSSSPADTTSPAVVDTTAPTVADTIASAGPVPLATELTEGPFYLDLDLVRSDIVEDRKGAVLALSMVVLEAATGAPIEGAAVDIWHCDAEGVYSGVQAGGGAGDSATFLRGTQLSDPSGSVTFRSIYPGWYPGRAVHIHLKVHVGGADVHTGQLFFDDTFTDTVYAANTPYSARPGRDPRNDGDGIFGQGGAASVAEVAKSGEGYAGTITLGVQPA